MTITEAAPDAAPTDALPDAPGCAVEDCDGALRAKGLCAAHLHRLNRYGSATFDPVAARVKAACGVVDCERPCRALGVCNMHWKRLRKSGSTDEPLPRLRPLSDRLTEMTVEGEAPALYLDLGPCLLFTGALDRAGYGRIGVGGRGDGVALAHRAAYALEHGEVPDGLEVDHLCYVRHCVRGGHLEAVPKEENIRRMREHGRRVKAFAAIENTLWHDLREADRRRPRTKVMADLKAAGKWGVGPSDASSCRKAVQYRENPPEDYEPIPTDKRAAYMGTLIHEGVERVRKRLYPWRRFEQPVVIPGLDRPGRYDEYDPYTEVLVDTKSAGDWKWDVVGEAGPPDEEWEQVMLYAFGLIAEGRKVREVRINYVQRANGRDEVFVRPYDEAVALRALDRLTAVIDALDAGIDLPRDRQGPSLDPICRTYCPARNHCWDIEAAEAAGRSPESWTLVHDDEDVEYALTAYDEARGRESAGKRDKALAKVLVEGVEHGHYGPMILGESGGNLLDPKPDPVARVAQLEAYYALPDGERPRLVDLPYPEVRKRSSVSISVKRERVAKTEDKARKAATGE